MLKTEAKKEKVKLSDKKIVELRELYDTKMYTVEELARRYMIALTTAYNILQRKTRKKAEVNLANIDYAGILNMLGLEDTPENIEKLKEFKANIESIS